jgi:hypothetical protein
MNGRRQRLAWFVFLGSFVICAVIALIIPLSINVIIQRSTRALEVDVQANQGTVGILQADNETGAVFAGDPAQSLDEGGAVLTNDSDTALLFVSSPGGDQQIARIQVYGNTNLALIKAATPRFGASSSDSELEMILSNGRLHLNIPEGNGRSFDFTLAVPHGRIEIGEQGQYSVSTSNDETQISVQQGLATVWENDSSLNLASDQRAVMSTNSPISGPLDTERNLIANGDFSSGFDQWVALAPNIEISDQPTVETEIVEISDEPAANFKRTGIGHADAGLRQIVNKDVTDFRNLRLVLSMLISEQSLGVCGQQGSECPIIVRLEYDDANGISQVWQQGFFANGTVGPTTPDVCVACPPPLNVHNQVPFQQLVFYESDNLIERLEQIGILPRQIKTITVIASGHTFDASILDVALLAQE